MRLIATLYLNSQFGKFLLAGGLAAAANFLSRFAFDIYMGYWAAVTAAFVVGCSTAFVLNRIFVFPPSGKQLRQEMAWFFFFNAVAFPVVLAASLLLSRLFELVVSVQIAKAAAHGVAILLPVVVNFVAHKFITFRRAPEVANIKPN